MMCPPQKKSFPIERTQGGGGGGGGGESGGKVFGFVPHSLLSPKEKKKKKMPGEVWHQRKSVVGRGHSEGFFGARKRITFHGRKCFQRYVQQGGSNTTVGSSGIQNKKSKKLSIAQLNPTYRQYPVRSALSWWGPFQSRRGTCFNFTHQNISSKLKLI